jgi:hypothetical protein
MQSAACTLSRILRCRSAAIPKIAYPVAMNELKSTHIISAQTSLQLN